MVLERAGSGARRRAIRVATLWRWRTRATENGCSRLEVAEAFHVAEKSHDWKVLVTATVVVAGDHLVRGLVWPESVYGIVNPEWWRFLEHAFWVLFCISFLAISCTQTIKTWLQFAEEGGMMEALAESEWRKSSVATRAEEEAAKANP
jgi:hypothetical protein